MAAPVAARADGAADAAGAGVGVARISLIQGAVAVQRGDSATPVAAAVNAPVLGADYVTTGDGARAEVQFDGSSSVRLGANVQMRFTHLDTAERELQLAAGTIDLRLLRGTDGRSQIDTPSISIRPRAAGSYRVSVDAAGRTQVTVRSGLADIVTPQGAQPLTSATTLLAQGAAANPTTQSTDAIAYDDFDRFNRERDDREQRALADAQYTAPGVAGIDDLNYFGHWVTDAGYGGVWVPSGMRGGWVPYRDGRWVWEEGFGWTWLGYEQWGWAPYHYGRWYHSNHYGWCWYPERAFIAWRPAVVAFVNFGFGFSEVGWLPLAPYEPFYPWWGNRYGNNVTYVTNNYYYGNVNNGNVTVVNNGDDHNRKRGFGNMRYATYVTHDRFLKGDFDHMRAVDQAKLREVHPVRGVVPAVPTEANLRFSDRLAPAHLAVAAALIGGTFAGNDIAVRRTPFAQQRETLATVVKARTEPQRQQPAAQGIPVTSGTTTTMVPVNAVPARTTTAARNANAVREASDPWARFGASRGTPVTHAVVSASAVNATQGGATTATSTTRGNTAVTPRNAPDAEAWRHFDTTRPAGPRDATTMREPNANRDATATRTNSAPRESREYNAPRSVQQSAPAAAAAQQHAPAAAPPAQQQQRSVPPPAATHAEHASATKSTSPH